jgi:N-formylglutamate amidohydrolase
MMFPATTLPLVLHIPHSGTLIPDDAADAFLDQDLLKVEQNRLTDWHTDELFYSPGAAHCATRISRLVVDLERYADDEQEPKAAVGQGVIYTRATTGECLRDTPCPEQRRWLLDQYYRPWHMKLEVAVLSALQRRGVALLIDAHSFPAEPFANEDDGGRERPDICLGTGANTPGWLIDTCRTWCAQHGLSLAIDFPYAGCLVPERYSGDSRVPAIMIEVNRGLYLDQRRLDVVPARGPDFCKVKALLSELLLELCGNVVNRACNTRSKAATR